MELVDDRKTPLFFGLQFPSLKELALVRIARSIWINEEVITEFHRVQNFFGKSTRRNFRPLEKKAKRQISRLPLPTLIAKDISPLVNFVGGVLHHWIDLFERKTKWNIRFQEWPDRIHFDYIIRDQLRWTPYGTLDYQNTAKSLLRDETIPLQDRFELACNFCLEEEVRRLQGEIALECRIDIKDSLLNWEETCNSFANINPRSVNNSSPFNRFRHPFIWRKLSDNQKNSHLLFYSDHTSYSTFINDNFFLFNKMTYEQQRNVLDLNACSILQALISRPWQHLFFDTFDSLRDHLADNDFYMFLVSAPFNQCEEHFLDRFYVEVGPWIIKSCHHVDGFWLIPSFAFHVWEGNVDFVRGITSQLPTSFRFKLIEKTFDKPENVLFDYSNWSAEILEDVKGLIEEWVQPEEWPALKLRIRRVLEVNQQWVGLEQPLEKVFLSLDGFFGEKLSLDPSCAESNPLGVPIRDPR